MQGRYLVAVVGSDNKVAIRPVEVAEQVGAEWIIAKGLKPGERIVAEGIQKVKEGLTVNPRPFGETAQKKQEVPSKPEAASKPEKR
jgi:membrane fusion protein (multidrug efflux system)